MRDYRHLTRFPGKDKAILEDATAKTGLSVNQIIVRSVHDALPRILKEFQPDVDLSPLPDSVIERCYGQMTAEELRQDNALGEASIRAQRSETVGH